MLVVLMGLGCMGSVLSIPDGTAPGDQTAMTGTLGVDPETEAIWAAVQEPDPDLQAELDDLLERLTDGRALLEDEVGRWGELQVELMLTMTTRVYRVDPATLRASEVGSWVGLSAPLAKFTTLGPVLSSPALDAEGYPIQPAVYLHSHHPAEGAAMLSVVGPLVRLSPTREWLLMETEQGTARLSPDLLEQTPLGLGEGLGFTPLGAVSAQAGPFRVSTWDVVSLEPGVQVQLPPMSGELLGWTFHPELSHAVVSHRVERGQKELLSVDLVSGESVAMPGFTGGRYSTKGGFYYQSVREQVLLFDTQTQTGWQVEAGIGAAMITPDDRWLLVESVEGLEIIDLDDELPRRLLVDVDLGQNILVDEQIWALGPDSTVHIIHLKTGAYEAWDAPCDAKALALMPISGRVVLRCQQFELRVFDPEDKHMVGVVRLR